MSAASKHGQMPISQSSHGFPCDDESDLHWACWDSDCDEVQRLLAVGEQVNAISETDGGTPLMRACEANAVSCAHMCLDAGAEVNLADEHGRTALHFAWASGRPGSAELAEDLLARGARGCMHSSCQKCRMKHKLLARQAARRMQAPVLSERTASRKDHDDRTATEGATNSIWPQQSWVAEDTCCPASPPSSPTRSEPKKGEKRSKRKEKKSGKKQLRNGKSPQNVAASTGTGTTAATSPVASVSSSVAPFSAKTMQVFAEEFTGPACSVEALLASFRSEDLLAHNRRAARCA